MAGHIQPSSLSLIRKAVLNEGFAQRKPLAQRDGPDCAPAQRDICADHLIFGQSGEIQSGLIGDSPDKKIAEFDKNPAGSAAGDGRPVLRTEFKIGGRA